MNLLSFIRMETSLWTAVIMLCVAETYEGVEFSLDPLIKGSLKVGEAMKRYPGSTRPEETGFAVGNNTELALFQWLVAHPKIMQHFNQCLEVMAKSSYHRLRTVYPWQALGKAKVIDIGGGERGSE